MTKTTIPSEGQLKVWLDSGGHRGWKLPYDCSDTVFNAAISALINHACVTSRKNLQSNKSSFIHEQDQRASLTNPLTDASK